MIGFPPAPLSGGPISGGPISGGSISGGPISGGGSVPVGAAALKFNFASNSQYLALISVGGM